MPVLASRRYATVEVEVEEMRGDEIVAVSLGASGALGRTVWSSAAAQRAGIGALRDHPYMIDAAGWPMRVAIADWLDVELPVTERINELLYSAIDEAIEPILEANIAPFKIGLSLGFPAVRPGLAEGSVSRITSMLRHRYRGTFSSLAIFETGHAGGLMAMNAAIQSLKHGRLDACVVAGADSYFDPLTLEWLDATSRLHASGMPRRSWGFTPGEAGGALLLMRMQAARAAGLEPMVEVLACASAFEPQGIRSDGVCIGTGLSDCFRSVLGGLPDGNSVTDIYCDMNGEPYRADEYGFAALRTGDSFESVSDFETPADCWGDVGAASGPLGGCLAICAAVKGYSRGSIALIFTSSDAGQRAAAVLRHASPG